MRGGCVSAASGRKEQRGSGGDGAMLRCRVRRLRAWERRRRADRAIRSRQARLTLGLALLVLERAARALLQRSPGLLGLARALLQRPLGCGFPGNGKLV